MSIASYLNRPQPNIVYSLTNEYIYEDPTNGLAQMFPISNGTTIGQFSFLRVISENLNDNGDTPLTISVPAGTYTLNMKGAVSLVGLSGNPPIFTIGPLQADMEAGFMQLALVEVPNVGDPPFDCPILAVSSSKYMYAKAGTVDNYVVFNETQTITLTSAKTLSMIMICKNTTPSSQVAEYIGMVYGNIKYYIDQGAVLSSEDYTASFTLTPLNTIMIFP